jgi:hypothetical protein
MYAGRMTQYVRATAMQVTGDSSMPPLFLDLVIDEAGNVQGDDAIFGFQGSVNPPDGPVGPIRALLGRCRGYGHEATDGRYAKMEIRDRSLTVGRALELHYKDIVQSYKITAVRAIVVSA